MVWFSFEFHMSKSFLHLILYVDKSWRRTLPVELIFQNFRTCLLSFKIDDSFDCRNFRAIPNFIFPQSTKLDLNHSCCFSGQHLSNQNYEICIRRESQFCSICFEPNINLINDQPGLGNQVIIFQTCIWFWFKMFIQVLLSSQQ